MAYLTDAGQQALEQAVVDIESVSAAEVVIAIRPRARTSLVQHAVVGIVTAIAILAFTLYSPLEFSVWQILVMPVFAGVAGAFFVEAVPPLYRWLSPASERYDHVREAAYAAFVERGIHSTRERTGILIYVALRERMVEIVADLGVLKHHGIEVLAAWAGTLEARVPEGPEALARGIRALAPVLEKSLPRRDDDVDELANGIQMFSAPPRQRKGAR